MAYDPATRILSLSFARDPSEQADVMLEAGRRMMTSTEPLSAWTGFGIAIGFGAVVGIVMEIHRRFLLPLVLGPSEIAPLGTVVMQLLPLVLLLAVLYATLHVRTRRSRREAIIARLQPDQVVDVDVFLKGVSMSGGHTTIDVDWPAVKQIIVDDARVELECESFVVYIPARAFDGNISYAEAVKEIRKLWRDAARQDRDRKMIEAGLD
jgi:hypothetical protein